MDDKSFELLEKLYSVVQDTNRKVDALDNKVSALGNRVSSLEGHATRLENEMRGKFGALFDAVDGINNKLLDHDKRFDVLEGKVDVMHQELKLLSNKGKRHSYEIGALKRRKAE